LPEPAVEAATDADAASLVSIASQTLAVGGLSDLVWGHVSVRDHAARGVWMKSAGWGFEEVMPGRVLLVSDSGEVLVGSGQRHIEYLIHTHVMAYRPDVGAVVHAHSDVVNAFASLEVPLRALSHSGLEFADPQLPRFTRTANLIRTDELGHALAETLGGAPAAFIPHHGMVTVGATAAQAVMRAVLLTRACQTHLMALSAGGPRSWIGAELQDMGWPGPQVQAGWNYLSRKLSGTGKGTE
jgi:ribulose-5-phosphate 4-epimerase/fuculose-1-phosphate aldolase